MNININTEKLGTLIISTAFKNPITKMEYKAILFQLDGISAPEAEHMINDWFHINNQYLTELLGEIEWLPSIKETSA